MNAAARKGLWGPAVATLTAFAVLIGLGTWQLERKAWKENLIESIGRKLAAAPVDLPPAAGWARLDRSEWEFRRVRFAGEFRHDREALVYTTGSTLRTDVSGPGYWVLSPARFPSGSIVVVNRGFVPEGKQDPKTRPEGQPSGAVDIVGAMRWPEPRGMFTPNDAAAKNLWFVRDPTAIAAAKGWGVIAPFYIDQEAPPPPGGLPKVGPLRATLPNNHLQYAVTWYGLALVVLISGVLFLRARRREVAS